MFKKKISLRAKLMISFSFIMLNISILIVVTTLQTAYKHSEKQLAQRFEYAKHVLLYKLSIDGKMIRSHLKSLAKELGETDIMAETVPNLPLISTVIQEELDQEMIDFIQIYDKNRQLMLGSISQQLPNPIDPISAEQMFIVSVGDETYMVSSAPVFSPGKSVIAWVLIGKSLSQLLNNEVRNLTGFRTRLLQNSEPSNNHVFTKARLKTDFLSTNPRWETALINGRTMIVYRFTVFDTPDYYFSFFTDISSAFLNFDTLSNQLIIAIFFSVIIGIVASYYFYRSFTTPLHQLVEVAKQIKAGNYKNTMPKADTSELQELSTTIESMQENIESREHEIYNLAYFNSLTKIPNRTFFIQRVEAYIQSNDYERFAVILIDIDGFKDINDTLGHDVGDNLLIAISQRISDIETKTNICCHVSGDEFAILVPNKNRMQLTSTINQYEAAFNEAYLINEIELYVNASLGVVLYPEHSDKARHIMQYADIALNKCKESVAKHIIYSNELNTLSLLKLNLMSELHQALSQDKLSLYYQPKLDMKTNQISSLECLIRWNHPTHGLIQPDEFIPLAEKSGYIIELTRWVINNALAHMRSWTDSDLDISVSINISAVDLNNLKLPNYVSELLAEHNIDADRVTLEITESAVMDDPVEAIKALKLLARMGIKLSIDDFGTGYSSMSQLRKTPLTELKIDKSFVLELPTNHEDQKIVKSIAQLAHNLGLSVVAEGVEELDTLEILRNNGIEYAQGYYISKPMHHDEVLAFVKDFNNKVKRIDIVKSANRN